MSGISGSAGRTRRVVVSLCLAGLLGAASTAIAYGQALPGPVAPGRIEQPLRTQPALPPVGGGAIPALPGGVQAPAGAESTRFVLRQVRVTGVTVYFADVFAGLYQDLIGKEVTLAQIYGMS